MHFSLVSQLDKNPDSKYKPHGHREAHHDSMFVTDLHSAFDSLGFRQTANGSVLCYDTVPTEFLYKIINLRSGSEKFAKPRTEKETSPTNKSKRDLDHFEQHVTGAIRKVSDNAKTVFRCFSKF